MRRGMNCAQELLSVLLVSLPVAASAEMPTDPQPGQPTPAFQQGAADRQTWESWFGGLSGDYRAGAEYWAGQRNMPKPGSCYGPAGQNLGARTAGCIAAQQRLATPDIRRKTEPDYWRGWNSVIVPAAGSGSVPPIGSGNLPAASDAAEIVFWKSVESTKNPAELQAYLNAYPQGRFAPLARLRLASLAGRPDPTTEQTVPPNPPTAVSTEHLAEIQAQKVTPDATPNPSSPAPQPRIGSIGAPSATPPTSLSTPAMQGSSQPQPTPDRTVRVTGYGATIGEARNDAIRQALQRTMKQLVVVDRLIKNDEIVYDKIMSTMNGYVENFHEIRLFRQNEQVGIEAELTISVSRVENYLGGPASGQGSTIAGAALGLEAQREIAQRSARGEIFDRLFRGFPSDAFEISVRKIAPDPDDPRILSIDLEVVPSPAFLASLKTGLSALADQKQSLPHLDLIELAKVEVVAFRAGGHPICLFTNIQTECYILPKGDYGSSFKMPRSPTHPNIGLSPAVVVMRFLDSAGQSVGLEQYAQCAVAQPLDIVDSSDAPAPRLAFIDWFFASGSEASWLNAAPRRFRARIPLSGIDLSKLHTIAAYLAGLGNGWVGSQGYPPRTSRDNFGLHSGAGKYVGNAAPKFLTDLLAPLSDKADLCGERLDRRARLTVRSE